MIRFDKLWEIMNQKGVSTYTLREKYGIDGKTINRLKNNKNTETKTLNKLCVALNWIFIKNKSVKTLSFHTFIL